MFAYILEGFGPLPAFLFGWTELTVIRASALGAIATIFAEYLGYFVPLTPEQVRYVAAAAILFVGALNYVGVSSAAVRHEHHHRGQVRRARGAGAAGLHRRQREPLHFTPAFPGGLDLSLMGTALIAIMWTYDGWADLSFMGGEVKNPGRTLPLALILGTAAHRAGVPGAQRRLHLPGAAARDGRRQAHRRHRRGADPAVRPARAARWSRPS